ncbi:MAG TPA: hypothetical protein VMH90_02130, partial [Thermoplasmata archaeon]|nr:hypothetical protein [Thermoplasmata archaeon]
MAALICLVVLLVLPGAALSSGSHAASPPRVAPSGTHASRLVIAPTMPGPAVRAFSAPTPSLPPAHL